MDKTGRYLDELRELHRFFWGHWELERQIYIKNTGLIHASAQGTACFAPGSSKGQLYYEERGRLIIKDKTSEISFTRKFRYEIGCNNMDVFFADGSDIGMLYQRYIHGANNKLIPDRAHVCSKDIYQGEYHLSGAHSFSLDTLIDGPNKDFIIKTSFTRVF